MENEINKEILKKVKSGQYDEDDFTQYIINTLPVPVMARMLAKLYIESLERPQPIMLSLDDYTRLTTIFQPKGIRPDGTKETRGRKKKNVKPSDEEIDSMMMKMTEQ